MIGAIAVEGSRCAGRVGERYIGVRSEQICGVPGQARRVVFRSPVKDMQRHVVTGAPSHQFGAGRAIDMDLHQCIKTGDSAAQTATFLRRTIGEVSKKAAELGLSFCGT